MPQGCTSLCCNFSQVIEPQPKHKRKEDQLLYHVQCTCVDIIITCYIIFLTFLSINLNKNCLYINTSKKLTYNKMNKIKQTYLAQLSIYLNKIHYYIILYFRDLTTRNPQTWTVKQCICCTSPCPSCGTVVAIANMEAHQCSAFEAVL